MTPERRRAIWAIYGEESMFCIRYVVFRSRIEMLDLIFVLLGLFKEE